MSRGSSSASSASGISSSCSGEEMRSARIAEENRYLLERQRQFRIAADVVTETWMKFPEVEAIAVIGSVAKPLWKEIPRFSEFRRAGIEVWHECKDLDLALWLASQGRLDELRRAEVRALRDAYLAERGISVVGHQVDFFLFEPRSNRYLGRLCSFNQCPKEKRDCLVPGCGAIRSTRSSMASFLGTTSWPVPNGRCFTRKVPDGCARPSICQRPSDQASSIS